MHIRLHHLLLLTTHKLLTKLRTSWSFNFSSSSHALVAAYVTNTAFRSDCSFVPNSNLLTAITDSRLRLLLALLFCLLLALCSCFTGSWVPSLDCYFFTDSWVPTLFLSSLKLSPLTATRNLCRPRFVTTLDMMHCLLLKILFALENS